MLSDLRFRFRALFDRRAMERELDDELRFHLEHETEKYVRAGYSRAEAERRARVALGGLDRIKDDARDARGIQAVDSIRQDLRYALRGVRSKPGFSLAIILTLALGIGANTALFGIVDRLLFRAAPYLIAPDRVHRVYLRVNDDGEDRFERTMQYTRYTDLTRWATSFERTGVAAYRSVAIGTGENAREMSIGAVSASLFSLFDARPVLGRFFLAEEDEPPKGTPVVVLSHTFWQSHFGGRRDVLGRSIHIDRAVYTVIGVAPEGFVATSEGRAPVAFIPVTAHAGTRNETYFTTYRWSWLEMFARRKPDVAVETAHADLTNAFRRSRQAESLLGSVTPDSIAQPRGLAGHLQISRGPEASTDSRIVAWLGGVTLIVLLVACANVANLLLARAVARRREVALRLALGVTRVRLAQQLLVESALLAALGGGLGLFIAQLGSKGLRQLFRLPDDTGALLGDLRTVGYAMAITIGVAMLTGLAPLLQSVRHGVSDSLKSGSREGTYRRSRLRTALLVFQSALSVALLVGAGLFVRSLENVRALRLGYDSESIVYIAGNLRGMQLSDAETRALDDRLLRAAMATPGVANASLTISVPFYSTEARGLRVRGVDSVHKLGGFHLQAGSPSYFETIGTRILRGRGFGPQDNATAAPVVVVSEKMAKRVWPNRDAIGQELGIMLDGTAIYHRVVGIAEDIRGRRLVDEREHWYYLPIAQYGPSDASLFVRANGRATDLLEPLRRALQREMPGVSYVTAIPLSRMVGSQQRAWDFGAKMFVAFGVLALVLAAVGLYSVIAYAVAQRTHELGVRIALGASVHDVVRLIVGQGVGFAIAGVIIGSAMAWWAGKWVEPLLFSQKAKDPAVFAVVAAVLLVVAIVATLRPAIRATRVDPTVALRAD